jgi:ubiquinone/menaquinone biosynthesis C-methylase UbiE
MTISIKILSKKDYLKDNPLPKQEEVWDNISTSWKEFRQGKLPIVDEFLKKASSEFKNSEKCKIVDLGCGSGRNMIKNKDVEYYGVDFSQKQLENAKSYAEDNKIDAKFFKSSADKLPNEFKDNMFDSGLFIATLHCIEGKKERENALKEFYRVLKKNAEGLISVWDSSDERFNGLKGEVYMSWKAGGISHMRHYYLYTKKEIIDLLERMGFKILQVYEPREKDRFSRKNLIIKIKK